MKGTILTLTVAGVLVMAGSAFAQTRFATTGTNPTTTTTEATTGTTTGTTTTTTTTTEATQGNPDPMSLSLAVSGAAAAMGYVMRRKRAAS
jgi:hypothetical protein